MSADGSTPKPKASLSSRKRSSSRSRISKTEQRPRSTSKSRKTANTEPRKVKTSKVNSKDRSRSRNKNTENTIKNVVQKEIKNEDKEKVSVEPTKMVLRKRALPKDCGTETVRPVTPLQSAKEAPKPVTQNKIVKIYHHVSTNKYLYLITIFLFIALSLIIFNKQAAKMYLDKMQTQIIHFFEKQKKKISK
uniref:Uncharacterized protein n=1 Tax=Strongyloides stercoralis TaxID=6248 RepID=A0A0K0E0X5_STRER